MIVIVIIHDLMYRFLIEQEQDSLVQWFQYQHLPKSYSRHFFYVNFTKFQKCVCNSYIAFAILSTILESTHEHIKNHTSRNLFRKYNILLSCYFMSPVGTTRRDLFTLILSVTQWIDSCWTITAEGTNHPALRDKKSSGETPWSLAQVEIIQLL